MAGNSLGPRALYNYIDDNGNQGVYLTDVNLGSAINATLAGSGDPRVKLYGLRKRYVLCENADGTKKKRVTCPTNDSTAFLAGGTLSIDGEEFIVTGRVGEAQTFGKGSVSAGGGDGV